MGGSNAAMDVFFTYHKEMNYNIDYDLLHGAHNDTDLTTNATGHKRHQCIMVSALNCLHGSKLAPPRLPQFRECVQEYVNTVDVSQCLVWLSRFWSEPQCCQYRVVLLHPWR